jgi:hypothetical protein
LNNNNHTDSAVHELQQSVSDLVYPLVSLPFRKQDAQEALDALLARSVDINALTYTGKPLVDFLVQEHRFVVVQMLLDAGADPFNTLLNVIGVKAEGVERDIQTDIISDCLAALEVRIRLNAATSKQADHLLFTQLQQAIEVATKMKDTRTMQKIRSIISEQKLANGEPGGRFANNGQKGKKSKDKKSKVQPNTKNGSQSAKTVKRTGRTPHSKNARAFMNALREVYPLTNHSSTVHFNPRQPRLMPAA